MADVGFNINAAMDVKEYEIRMALKSGEEIETVRVG